MLKLCMKDYKDYGVYDIDHGSYTVYGTTCIEAQINGVVPRVFLGAMDYDDLLIPKKHTPKATRGRKRKNFEHVVYEMPQSVKRFNGGKISGKRLRKPNSKFSDFVLPINYNLVDEEDNDNNYEPDETSPPKTMKSFVNEIRRTYEGKIQKSRIKERILSSADYEHKQDAYSTVDPLGDGNEGDEEGGDVVHSFLPKYEASKVIISDDSDNEIATTLKSKDKRRKDNVTLTQGLPLKNLVTQPITILSPNMKGGMNSSSQLYGNVLCVPLILTTNSQNAVINVNDIGNQQFAILNQSDPRWVNILPKPFAASAASALKVPIAKSTSSRSLTPKGKPKYKVSSTPVKYEPKPKSKSLAQYKYVLADVDLKYKPPKVSDIDFNKLVRTLKSVKLPTKNWKIRIIVSPQETITEVIFTNKQEFERCVKFSRAVGIGYKITFGKTEVKLLGAPTLQTFEDIAVLLEIIDCISPKSHVLEYC